MTFNFSVCFKQKFPPTVFLLLIGNGQKLLEQSIFLLNVDFNIK